MKHKRLVLNLTEGYTLLELLVVIGLITVLMSFGAASYSAAQQKARDSKRRSDLKVLQNAMEQYYSVCKFKYPIVADGTGISTITTVADCTVGAGKVIVKDLLDPMGVAYKCSGVCDADEYTICPSTISGDATRYLETDTTCTTTTKSCCIKNQQ